MARIRTIKPEFWTDEKTGLLSPKAKCLFLGLLNISDDYGVLEWSPAEWKVKIFPYQSDTTPVVVGELLTDEILPAGLSLVFQVDEDDEGCRQYLFIRNFCKHQVINKPSKPMLDGWGKDDTPKTYAKKRNIEHTEIDLTSHTPIPEPSDTTPVVLPPGKEGKGEEGKGEKDNPNGLPKNPNGEDLSATPTEPALAELTAKKKRQPRKSQIPENFIPDRKTRMWAKENHPTVNLHREVESFINWHRSKGNTYVDAQRAFKTWVSRAKQYSPTKSNGADGRPATARKIMDLPPA